VVQGQGLVVRDKNNDKNLRSEDEDKDKHLQTGPRGSSRTRTFLDNNAND